ncbi:MAG: 6-phosphofructokinase [Tissierellia bacterium]|nr:6-phosphofructokinase [Tissierellia bacterium]
MKKIAVLTSGGDAPGMNAALRAVVRSAIYRGLQVLGVKKGYNGLIEGNMVEMDVSSVADIIHRGGTILGTARSDEFKTEEGIEKALDKLRVLEIDGLVVLGGDGTMRGALELSKRGIPVACIPCTIDNDLGYTDYAVGFMTATETVADAISRLRDTSSSHGRANVVEVMGRRCGDIALYSGLAGGAETIVVPEVAFDLDALLRKVLRGKNRGKRHHIIVLAEGAGNPYEISEAIQKTAEMETRVTILGHVQRGGTPTVFDRIMASQMGSMAVDLLYNGEKDRAIAINCNKIVSVPIEDALKTQKLFQHELLETAGMLAI